MFSELVCRTAFSFLEGASLPETLVDRAVELGLGALAITDRDGVYALPRAHRRAKERGLHLIAGALVTIREGPGMALLARNRSGWSNLCRLLTLARCAGPLDHSLAPLPPPATAFPDEPAPADIAIPDDRHPTASDPADPHHRSHVAKGRARLSLDRVLERSEGLEAILIGRWNPHRVQRLREAMGERVSLAVTRYLDSHDAARLETMRRLSQVTGVPLVATTDAVMATARDKRLQDVLTCIRLGCTVDEAGRRLDANAARHLRGPDELERLLPRAAVERSVEVSERCTFTLDDLHYRYPHEVVPPGRSPMEWLRELVDAGLRFRYPNGCSEAVRRQAEHELALIEKLDFPAYFLTVYDVVRFARERGILCQGRGSAANSVVCWALGITSVDPSTSNLLFERFISEERGEPPDIDVDFEHERREEVFAYVWRKYGRHRAAMVNEVICWRWRYALRDVGKVLGLSLDQVDRLAKSVHRFDKGGPTPDGLRRAGLDPTDRRVALTVELAGEMLGLPRHVGIHVGGFTISDGPLVELCPIEPATMPGRTVIQWDKDDLDVVGFVKVDLLSLGILTAIRKCFALIHQHPYPVQDGAQGPRLTLASVPREDPAVYEMLCRGDSMGVFQVESRAQMAMLPRMKPRCWYDLVIQVSIVRPGPIQGGMVHPYLRRRAGREPVTYAHPDLVPILERTLGVPIFQEQVMAMAVAVGGFSPGQADALRRAMGAWRKRGGLALLTEKLVKGMRDKGIPERYAEQIAMQIQGFGEYGFPESHAASFARLVYVSAWLKCHYPAAYCAALLNSQPMGFYSPRSLIADARRHGVEVREVDVQHSHWDCTLEPNGRDFALRLGFRLVNGLRETAGRAIVRARSEQPFRDLEDLVRRTGLDRDPLTRLARAGALQSLPLAPLASRPADRRQAVWAVRGLFDLPLFRGLLRQEPPPPLPSPTAAEELCEDFRTMGLSVAHHPLAMVRPELRRRGFVTAAEALRIPNGRLVRIAGLVSHRQAPDTAGGIVFMTVEDETQLLNVVVKPRLLQRQRHTILGQNLVRITARVQREGDSLSLLALTFAPLTLAPQVATRSRDFR